jgi:uncharacterized oligopeptide transporter (OPT) family protein
MSGGTGFGGKNLAAPQAGLMASLSQGIVGGDMAWPLICVGLAMGVAMIMMQVRSPMLIAVGMYLPLDTTFAIFVGGLIRWMTDTLAGKQGFNAAQRTRVENLGVLVASGMITGEGLMGLVEATVKFFALPWPEFNKDPSYLLGCAVMAGLAFVLIKVPLGNAGSPDEPNPPSVAH